MRGTMMDFPLTLQHVFERGTRLFPDREIVTGGTARRATATPIATSASASTAWPTRSSDLGLQPGDRVGDVRLEPLPPPRAVLRRADASARSCTRSTFACSTISSRTSSITPPTASSSSIGRCCPSFAAATDVRDGRADRRHGRRRRRASWATRSTTKQLLSSGADHCDFPRLDENDAAMMCYTSGTTGNPKGVAYSHRALTLHSFGACTLDSLAVSQRDTVMAIVPMFHANAWGLPYASTLVGAKQVFPGNSLTAGPRAAARCRTNASPWRGRADDLDRRRCRCCRRASTT